MSTREMAHELVDKLTEAKLRSFIIMFGENSSFEIPNEETLKAYEEIEEMKKYPERYKGYTDVNEMMRELLE